MRLQVIGTADASVHHDRRSATRLHGSRRVAIAAAAIRGHAIEGVIASELVPSTSPRNRRRRGRRPASEGRCSLALCCCRRPHRGWQCPRRPRPGRCARHQNSTRQRAVPITCRVRVSVALVRNHRGGIAGGTAAGSVRAGHLSGRVQVQRRYRDQHETDRRFLFVDLRDPVDQRDLRGRDVRRAEVSRIARVAQEREAIRTKLMTATGDATVWSSGETTS